MLGWHISVHRQKNGGALPATAESSEGARLAVWQTGLDGLRWLYELVKTGDAIHLGGDGYPLRFTSTAEYLVPGSSRIPRKLGALGCTTQAISSPASGKERR